MHRSLRGAPQLPAARLRMTRSRLWTAVAVLAFAAVGVVAPAGAHEPARWEQLTSSFCGNQLPIVVASDGAAHSDRHAAVSLAWAAATTCVIDAGPRSSRRLTPFQRERLHDALGGGYVIGGTAAVSRRTVANRFLHRLAGNDRQATAAAVAAEVERLRSR